MVYASWRVRFSDDKVTDFDFKSNLSEKYYHELYARLYAMIMRWGGLYGKLKR